MSLRDTINKNPGVATGVVAVLVVLAIGYALYSIGLFGGGAGVAGSGEVFIMETGDTYRPGQADEIYELSPNGEPNAIAYVFQYPGGEPFVHYFERLNPKALEAIKRLPADSTDFAVAMQREDINAAGREVRRPGETRWVPAQSEPGLQISDMPPPSEQGESAIIVLPD